MPLFALKSYQKFFVQQDQWFWKMKSFSCVYCIIDIKKLLKTNKTNKYNNF